MLIYKDGVYKNCTERLYADKYKSLGYGVATPLPEVTVEINVEDTTEDTAEEVIQVTKVERPKPRPRKGKK